MAGLGVLLPGRPCVFCAPQPERINPETNHKGYNVKSDIWSLGITLVSSLLNTLFIHLTPLLHICDTLLHLHTGRSADTLIQSDLEKEKQQYVAVGTVRMFIEQSATGKADCNG